MWAPSRSRLATCFAPTSSRPWSPRSGRPRPPTRSSSRPGHLDPGRPWRRRRWTPSRVWSALSRRCASSARAWCGVRRRGSRRPPTRWLPDWSAAGGHWSRRPRRRWEPCGRSSPPAPTVRSPASRASTWPGFARTRPRCTSTSRVEVASGWGRSGPRQSAERATSSSGSGWTAWRAGTRRPWRAWRHGRTSTSSSTGWTRNGRRAARRRSAPPGFASPSTRTS